MMSRQWLNKDANQSLKSQHLIVVNAKPFPESQHVKYERTHWLIVVSKRASALQGILKRHILRPNDIGPNSQHMIYDLVSLPQTV